MGRITPISPDRWPPEMREAAAALRPSVRRHADFIRENRPQAPGALETFAHNPDLARAFLTFNGYVLYNTMLTTRQRQILILRVAARRECAYLWAQHVFQGRDAGMADEEIARIAFGPEAPFFDPLDTALLRAVDELVDDGLIAEETWDVLASHLDEQQLLDLVFVVGCYETLAWFFRTLGLEPDPGIPEMLRR